VDSVEPDVAVIVITKLPPLYLV